MARTQPDDLSDEDLAKALRIVQKTMKQFEIGDAVEIIDPEHKLDEIGYHIVQAADRLQRVEVERDRASGLLEDILMGWEDRQDGIISARQFIRMMRRDMDAARRILDDLESQGDPKDEPSWTDTRDRKPTKDDPEEWIASLPDLERQVGMDLKPGSEFSANGYEWKVVGVNVNEDACLMEAWVPETELESSDEDDG